MPETPISSGASAPKTGAANESFEAGKAATSAAVKSVKETAKVAEDAGEKTARTFATTAEKIPETGTAALEKIAETNERAIEAAVAVGETAAKAPVEAAAAGAEVLGMQAATVQSAAASGLETGVKSLQGLADSWSRTVGLGAPGADLAESSSRNLKAVSQASTALAKGAQDASRLWLELTQKTVRSNIEALGQVSQVKTLPELFALQGKLVRDSLEQAIATGEEIARLSSGAIREATLAMRPTA